VVVVDLQAIPARVGTGRVVQEISLAVVGGMHLQRELQNEPKRPRRVVGRE
jgi:hypothetical protein